MAGIMSLARIHGRNHLGLIHDALSARKNGPFRTALVSKNANTHANICSALFSSVAGGATLPSEAEVVVCGGGVMGASVALHLQQLGWRNVVLLEKGSLTCGTTWHSVGLLGRLKSSGAETAMAHYSRELYKQLEAEGYHTGWKECGALYLARTHDRLISYKRARLTAELMGVEGGREVSKDEIKDLVPHLYVDDLQGGIYVPGDGVVSAPDACLAMAKKAKDLGVKVMEKVEVEKVLTEQGKVVAVKTSQGDIKTPIFVNAAGMWSRELGQKCTTPVRVPLHACEHFYIVTKPVDNIDRMMPVVRDYDGYIYLREWSGGILVGGFEPVAKPVFHEGVPEKFEFQLLPEDWDQFQVHLEQMLHRMPMLETAGVKQFVNGPESFTPDGKYIFGETPEVQGYYVATGMNSSGITAAGGAGKYIAEWITDGTPSRDMWSCDVRRFVDLHNNKKFLRDRVKETLGMHSLTAPANAMPQFNHCRSVKATPLHKSQELAGAVFEQQLNLYERAAWFTESGYDDYDIGTTYGGTEEMKPYSSFGKPMWFDKVKAEYWACRSSVCLIDMSTFTKFEFKSPGREAEDFLQHICSNDIAPPEGLGTIVHTGMQNKQGGYENDCSVVRLDDNRFFMIGPTAQQTRSLAWINHHLPRDGSVQVHDVTSMYTAINVIGPKARELIGELTDTSLTKADFQHMTCKEIDIAQASGIKAMRLTHSGEDGWILYIPSEYALHVYDSLMHHGKNYDIRNAGYYALRALRTEKFFAYWGTDLTPNTTPLESGRGSRVKWNKGGFIGYEALQLQKKQGIRKKLVQLLLDDHDIENEPWPWGGEPIYRNDVLCGVTTSTAYGFTLDKHVCLGYVHDFNPKTQEHEVVDDSFITKNAKFEVNIAGKRYPAKANIFPPALPSAAIKI